LIAKNAKNAKIAKTVRKTGDLPNATGISRPSPQPMPIVQSSIEVRRDQAPIFGIFGNLGILGKA
jgi:hypothetical protein